MRDLTLRETRLGRFVRRHERLHSIIHGTYCRVIGPFDTRRVATTGTGVAGTSSTGSTGSTGDVTSTTTSVGPSTHVVTYSTPPSTAGGVLFEAFDHNGNRVVQMNFPDLAAADAYLKANYVLSPTGSVGSNGTYDIYASDASLLEYGYIINTIANGLSPPSAPQQAPISGTPLTSSQQSGYVTSFIQARVGLPGTTLVQDALGSPLYRVENSQLQNWYAANPSGLVYPG